MPRLEDNAVRVDSRIREVKSESVSVLPEPVEGGSMGEGLLERGFAGSNKIKCAAGVVLAVTRCRDTAEDVGQRDPGLLLASNNLSLSVDAAESGHGRENDPIVPRGGLEGSPSCGRGDDQPDLGAVVGRGDRLQRGLFGLSLQWEPARWFVVQGDAKFAMEIEESGHRGIRGKTDWFPEQSAWRQSFLQRSSESD